MAELALVKDSDIPGESGNLLRGYEPELLQRMGHIAAEVPERNLAEFLLSPEHTATAVYWLGEEETDSFTGLVRPQLLGVNYGGGAHSEGTDKIVVQDVENHKGPWVLFAPPGSDHRTFHLEDVTLPRWNPPTYSSSVVNPLKIKEEYLYTGDPGQVFEDLKAQGYDFVDTPLPLEEYQALRDAARSQNS